MPASVTSPADMVNLALRRIGYKLRVSNLFDGSRASGVALDIYAQTRDAVMRDGNWDFCSRTLVLELLKQAPAGGYVPPNNWSTAYPAQPWMFEYSYPADCLKVRAIKNTAVLLPNFDPQPNTFSVANDTGFSPARKVILTDVPAALMIYTGQVTNPATWEASFIEAFAASLARRLAPSLADMEVTKLEAGDEAASNAAAQMERG